MKARLFSISTGGPKRLCWPPVKQTKRDRAGLGQSIQGAAPWKSALAAGNKPFSRKRHSGHFQVDANHNGVMDNRDLTSVNNPNVSFG